MVLPPRIRRQAPGARVQQTTISLPGDDMEWLRKQAYARRITVSLYVRNVLQAWKAGGYELPAAPPAGDAAGEEAA